MSTDPFRSPVRFFAELGDLLAKYSANASYAIAMVIVSWVIWPIGALIASLLIASLYLRAHPELDATETNQTGFRVETPPPRTEGDWLVLVGLLLIALGAFWLMRELVWFPWYAVLIVIGLLLVLLGLARRGGGAEHV